MVVTNADGENVVKGNEGEEELQEELREKLKNKIHKADKNKK